MTISAKSELVHWKSFLRIRRQHAQCLPVYVVDDGGGEQQAADPPSQVRNDVFVGRAGHSVAPL